jgi:succinate-acetate transporter protein
MPPQSTSGARFLGFLLFPFKAYTVVAVVAVLIWGSALPRHSHGAALDTAVPVLAGYVISAVALFLGGLVQLIAGARSSGLASLVFALAALVIALCLAPMFSAA